MNPINWIKDTTASIANCFTEKTRCDKETNMARSQNTGKIIDGLNKDNEALAKQLDRDDISEEERAEILATMERNNIMNTEYAHTENKEEREHKERMADKGLVAFKIVLVGALSFCGLGLFRYNPTNHIDDEENQDGDSDKDIDCGSDNVDDDFGDYNDDYALHVIA